MSDDVTTGINVTERDAEVLLVALDHMRWSEDDDIQDYIETLRDKVHDALIRLREASA